MLEKEKTNGQFLYEKWGEYFTLRPMQDWYDLPQRSKANWEKLAEEVSLDYIERKDNYA